MDEDQYQLGIRKLPTDKLVTLVIAYRNKLKGCANLCKAFAEENYAQQPLHKVACAHLKAEIDQITTDFEWAIKVGS